MTSKKRGQIMKERKFPEIEKFERENIKQERDFFNALSYKATEKEQREFEFRSGMSLEEEKEKLLKAKEVAKKYRISVPGHIERECREWTDSKAYIQIKKTSGHKQPLAIIQSIHERIPLSLKGFKMKTGQESIQWTRMIGKKNVRIICHVGDDGTIKKPAAGDLAKRAVMTIVKFAVLRETGDPGPILFREILEHLGALDCSQITRKNIYDYLTSFCKTWLEISEKDDKGKEIGFTYAPVFKLFEWKGGLNFNARIFPIFNEEFGKAILRENLAPYFYLVDERLKPQKRLADRDRLVQDKLQMLQGLDRVPMKMKNTFLIGYAQFTKSEIETFSLKKIREFVDKQFLIAVQNRRIKSETIKSIRKFRSKSKYLNQTFVIYPEKMEFKDLMRQLSFEEDELIDDIIYWAYAKENKFAVKNPREKTRSQLETVIKKYGVAKVRECFEDAKREQEEGEPIIDEGKWKSAYMLFWEYVDNLKKRERPKLLI